MIAALRTPKQGARAKTVASTPAIDKLRAAIENKGKVRMSARYDFYDFDDFLSPVYSFFFSRFYFFLFDVLLSVVILVAIARDLLSSFASFVTFPRVLNCSSSIFSHLLLSPDPNTSLPEKQTQQSAKRESQREMLRKRSFPLRNSTPSPL